MKVRIEKGVLFIEIELLEKPRLSTSGKNRTIATTGGNTKTALEFKGEQVTIGLNAYIPAEEE